MTTIVCSLQLDCLLVEQARRRSIISAYKIEFRLMCPHLWMILVHGMGLRTALPMFQINLT